MKQQYKANFVEPQISGNPTFNPNQIGSSADAMQAEFSRQNQGLKLVREQQVANQKTALNIQDQKNKAAIAEAKKLEELSKFSKTLASGLTTWGKSMAEKQVLEGQQIYFEQGVPAEQQAAWNQGEEEMRQQYVASTEIADTLEQQGQPSVAREARELSGYRALGYIEARVQDAAVQYPAFISAQKENLTMNINGRDINYNQANTLAERNALMTAIRASYINQYKDLNPALLNKYLYPKMREAEASELIQWNKNQSDLLKKDRQDDANNALISGIKSGNGGAAVYRMLETMARDFGGDRGVREEVQRIVNGLIDARSIGTDEVQSITGFRFKNRSGKWTTLGEQFPVEFGEFQTRLIGENAQAAEERETIRATAQSNFDSELKELFKGGRLPNAEEKKAIIAYHDSNIGGEQSSYIQGLVTQQEEFDSTKKEQLDALRASRPGGYLTETDLIGSSPEVYNAYKQYIKDPTFLGQEGLVQQGVDMITAQLKLIAPTTGDGKFSHPAAVRAKYKAEALFKAQFAENLKTMDPAKAYEQAEAVALKALTPVRGGDKLQDLPILKTTGETRDREAQENQDQALRAINKDSTIIKTGVIPGTEKDLEQLVKYAETQTGSIPDIYRVVAANSNGKLSAWDVAQLQLQASGKGSLLRIPDAEQAVQELRPELKQLLTYRPTTGRTQRVAVAEGDNWSQFLELVASVESKGYGDYDAMNVPYSNTPYNSVDRIGRGLSTMTIGEVLALQASDHVHAAGRYQFTNNNGTLTESMAAAGLTPDDPFNAENQDRLAVARARWRMQQDKGMSGLRREWVGLNYVPDAVLRPAMQGIVNERSPFNQLNNLSPNVAQAVYTTGNIGPTSTGPHLDVKRTNGAFFKYSDLNNYVDVEDPDMGRVPLGKVPQTGDWLSHTRRNSHGRDYGTASGSTLHLKNGAKVISNTQTIHGDYMIIQLPDGRQFSFLHGKAIK